MEAGTPASPCWTNDQRNGQPAKAREVYVSKKQEKTTKKKKRKDTNKKDGGERKRQGRECGCYCCPRRQERDAHGKSNSGKEQVEENNNQQDGERLTEHQGKTATKHEIIKDQNGLMVQESSKDKTEKKGKMAKNSSTKKTSMKDKDAKGSSTKQRKKSTKPSSDIPRSTSSQNEALNKAEVTVLQQSFPVSRSKEQEWEQQIKRQEMHHIMSWTRTQASSEGGQGDIQTRGGARIENGEGPDRGVQGIEDREAGYMKEDHQPPKQEMNKRRVSEYDDALPIRSPATGSSDAGVYAESEQDTVDATSSQTAEITQPKAGTDKEFVSEETAVKATASSGLEEESRASEEHVEGTSGYTDGQTALKKQRKNAKLQVTLPMTDAELDRSPTSSKSPQTATSFTRAGFGVLKDCSTVHNRTVNITLKNRAKCVLVEAEFLLGDRTDLVSKLGRVIECKSQGLLKLTQMNIRDDIQCVCIYEVQGVRSSSTDPWFLYTQLTWQCKTFDPEYKIGFMNASYHQPEDLDGKDVDLLRKLRIGAVRRIKPRVIVKRGMAHTEVLVELRDD